jgi:hypothetical protein
MAVDDAELIAPAARPEAGFSAQLGQHDAWRRENAARLQKFAGWLTRRQLLDAAGREQVARLTEQIKSDQVRVAFVAEFSRGKSELINAVFFAGYGRRIMPANAGRTTMCPTELGYDADLPPCLRLLPIETRLRPQGLAEWRMVPEQWTRVDLDASDPAQLAARMEQVSEVLHVSPEMARRLGFWDDDKPEDNPPVDADGRVQVPRWRHALINMAHPLLRQGLVVLDTPGLNAMGAEPELTVNLIAQMHAAVFILGADTGVTRSDMDIWRDHLAALAGSNNARLVVLNKIDTLWDEINTPVHIELEIRRQCDETARTLGLPLDRVVAISAQKGLLAKMRGDTALLQKSRLPVFEDLLARTVLGGRRQILEDALCAGVSSLQAGAREIMDTRRRELAEQMLELRELRGKNTTVIRQMLARVAREQQEFDGGAARMLQVRSAHTELLRKLFQQLGVAAIKDALQELAAALRAPGVKLSIKRDYIRSFDKLRAMVDGVQELEDQIHGMLLEAFRQLNAEYGFTLQVAPAPDLDGVRKDLDAAERSHLRYLSVGNRLRLARPEFSEKLLRALFSRVRSIFEVTLGQFELWNSAVFSPLEVQLSERHHAYGKRFDALKRIQGAAESLDAHLAAIDAQQRELDQTAAQLAQAASELRAIFRPSDSVVDLLLEPDMPPEPAQPQPAAGA